MAPRSVRRPSKPVSYLKGLMISFFGIVLLLGASNVGLFVNRRTTEPVVESSPIPVAVAPLNQTAVTSELPNLPMPPEPVPVPLQELHFQAPQKPDASLPLKVSARASRRQSEPSHMPDESTRAEPIRKHKFARVEEATAAASAPVSHRQQSQTSEEASAASSDYDVAWCLQAKKRYNVKPGSSWGSLRGQSRVEWGARGCDVVIATGRPFSCDDTWGEKYLDTWRDSERVVCKPPPSSASLSTSSIPTDGSTSSGGSKVTCRGHSATGSSACVFENVVLDFSKAPVSGNSRSFRPGFLQASCPRSVSVPLPPGAQLGNDPLQECDVVEETPSFFMSHDLILNLGHTISDFWIVFTTMRGLGLDFHQFRLVNMDAIRGNGPAGRGSKIGLAGHPDHLSPFFQQYEKWFGKGLMKSTDYQGKRVCFKKVVFQAKPGPAHIWTSLEAGKNQTAEKCSRTNRYSWLLHEYNKFNVGKWGLASSTSRQAPRLAPASSSVVKAPTARGAALKAAAKNPTITLITRKGSNMRVFANEKEVVQALQGIPGAGELRVVDFASIPFQEQVAVAHNTSLLVGMHGAALFHLLSMDVGASACCGVVELYHKRWSQSEAVPTVSNMARFLDMEYEVVRSVEPESVAEIRRRGKGTFVDTENLRRAAEKAIGRLVQRQ